MRTTVGQRAARWVRLAAYLVIGMALVGALPCTGMASGVTRRLSRLVGTVTGRVTDARTSQPIPGVTVEVEGTRLGATTAADGSFRIGNVPAGGRTIIVRRIGYTAARRLVSVTDGQQASVDFALQPSAVELDQVVVTGTAGGELRRSVGNVVSTIDASAELDKSAVQSLSGLLSGRAAGVVIAQGTSRLGAGPTVQIRGRTSLSLNNSPLLYIDGVRVNNSTAVGPVGVSGGGSSFGAQNSNVAGRLNDIDPEDIASIEIIKGPAAATIYGTEAANGVIQIITKKGQAGAKPEFTVKVKDGSLFFRDAENRVATNYFRDASNTIVAWNGVKSEKDHGTPLFKTGQNREYNASLSGGRDVLRYYLSSGYSNDFGVEPNNSLRQFSLHSNINVSASPTVELGTSLNYTDINAHLGADDGVSSLLGAMVGHGSLFTAARGFYPNFPPEIPQRLYDNSQMASRFTGSGTVNHRPTDWFTQRVVLGVDYTGDDSRALERFAPPTLAAFLPPSSAGGRIGQTLRHMSVITADYSGTAKAKLTDAIASSSSIGGQFYRTDLHTSSLGGYGFPGAGVEIVAAAANQVLSTQADTLNTTVGAYAQEQFGWNDRLFLTGAVRVDNNSAFGEDFKWVTYPKASLAWVVNEEPFWHFADKVRTLRLRAAYGESGRQPNAFAALRTFSPVQGPGGTSAVTPSSYGNPNLKPERGKELELGFETEVLDRLSLDFTYFSKRTYDEIVAQPVAPSSGFAGNRLLNLGRVDNHGIEARTTLHAIRLSNVEWDLGANVGTSKDVIKDLGGVPSVIASASQNNKVGYPIGGIFTRRVVSADRDATTRLATNVLCDGGPGAAPVACATAPFVFIGTPTPRTTGAITNTVTLYKNLRLYAQLDFKTGSRMLNANDEIRCLGLVGAPLCRENYYPDEFSPVRLAESVGTAFTQQTVDQYYQDASFWKLREVSAQYTLPNRFLWGNGSRASITLSARELHIWSKYKGPDPEVNIANPATSFTVQDQAVIPPLSSFSATINVRF
jgi:TonB-linked SusC/RagA family outer membrane protein